MLEGPILGSTGTEIGLVCVLAAVVAYAVTEGIKRTVRRVWPGCDAKWGLLAWRALPMSVGAAISVVVLDPPLGVVLGLASGALSAVIVRAVKGRIRALAKQGTGGDDE